MKRRKGQVKSESERSSVIHSHGQEWGTTQVLPSRRPGGGGGAYPGIAKSCGVSQAKPTVAIQECLDPAFAWSSRLQNVEGSFWLTFVFPQFGVCFCWPRVDWFYSPSTRWLFCHIFRACEKVWWGFWQKNASGTSGSTGYNCSRLSPWYLRRKV